MSWEDAAQTFFGYQQPDTSILQHEGKPLLRIGGIERDVDSPSLENAQKRNHHFRRAFETDTHRVFPCNTGVPQSVGQLVGTSF